MPARRPTALLISILNALTLSALPARAAGAVGDRLVVAINTFAYTQRQVEVYISVKESLRKTADGSVRMIEARNWGEALQAFTEDMTILQEAQRLGSFSAPDAALDKYNAVVKDKLDHFAPLRANFTRLGVDAQTEAHALDSVLRVAAMRRSKDRQEAQATPSKSSPLANANASASANAAKKTGGQPKWLTDLTERTVVRVYAGAATYTVIQPTLGGTAETPPAGGGADVGR